MKTDVNPYGSSRPAPQVAPLKSAKPADAPADKLAVPAKAPDYQVELSPEAKAKSEKADKPEKAEKPAKVEEAKSGGMKKPAIIFVSGWNGMSGSYAGVGEMAESVMGARLYDWDQKGEIVEHIKKTHVDQPVILVGHSLGGDTVKEVADELDTLEHGFRHVDLLVTLDAVGFGNDVIPRNVRQHLNVFGENSWPLNDGPHVARHENKTQVKNILSPLEHTELDDSRDVQYEVLQAINRALASR